MGLNFVNSGMHKCQDVSKDTSYNIRYRLKGSINSIMGEPIFPGSITIVNGESGTGKTTMLLQACCMYAKKYKTGYVSGEQNISFLKEICDNCKLKDVEIGNISDMDAIIDLISKYKILVIDSFPFITCNQEKHGKMSSTKQDMYILEHIAAAAQKYKCALFIILHSTKTGQYKGSTFIKHVVDNMITLSKNNGKVQVELVKSRLASPSTIELTMCSHGFQELYMWHYYMSDDNVTLITREEYDHAVERVIITCNYISSQCGGLPGLPGYAPISKSQMKKLIDDNIINSTQFKKHCNTIKLYHIQHNTISEYIKIYDRMNNSLRAFTNEMKFTLKPKNLNYMIVKTYNLIITNATIATIES